MGSREQLGPWWGRDTLRGSAISVASSRAAWGAGLMEGGPGSSVSQVVREGRLMPRPKPNHRGPRSPGTGQRDPLPAWASPVYWGSFWDAHARWGCRATGSSVLRVRWGSTHFTSSVAARPLENAPAVGGGAPPVGLSWESRSDWPQPLRGLGLGIGPQACLWSENPGEWPFGWAG